MNKFQPIVSIDFERPNACFDIYKELQDAVSRDYILIHNKEKDTMTLHTTDVLRIFFSEAFQPEGTYWVCKYKF
jgi:hypothetical protein